MRKLAALTRIGNKALQGIVRRAGGIRGTKDYGLGRSHSIRTFKKEEAGQQDTKAGNQSKEAKGSKAHGIHR